MSEIKNITLGKIASFVLPLTIAMGSFTSCKSEDKKTCVLDGTVLNGSTVVEFYDGSKDIAYIVGTCYKCSEHKGKVIPLYNSIVSGTSYSDSICQKEKINLDFNLLNKYEIKETSTITKYLTSEEIIKANNNELTDDDVNSIIERITCGNSEIVSIENSAKTR